MQISLRMLVSICLSLALALVLSTLGVASESPPLDDIGTAYVALDAVCGQGMTPCFGSIQDAVHAIDPGGVIKVAAGTYTETQTVGDFRQVVHVSKDLTIQGGYATDNWDVSAPGTNRTIIDAQGDGRCIAIVGPAAVSLRGLEIVHGDASDLGGYVVAGTTNGDAGGGIHVDQADVVLEACRMASNVASRESEGNGGALFAIESSVTISDCLFQDNTASMAAAGRGGAVCLAQASSSATIHSSRMVENAASVQDMGFGGALYAASSVCSLTSSEILSNTASSESGGYGGGLYCGSSSLSAAGCQIDGNRAGGGSEKDSKGGAIYGFDSDLRLGSSDLLRNAANVGSGAGFGGAVCLESTSRQSRLECEGNQLGNNSAAAQGQGYGGAIFVRGVEARIEENAFETNLAGRTNSYGGGIAISTRSVPVTGSVVVTNNLFFSNTATSASGGRGGAAHIGALPPISQVGYVAEELLVDQNTFQDNVAAISSDGRGGGIHMFQALGRVQGNAFRDNVASLGPLGEGGATYAFNSVLNLTSNEVYHNTASASSDGKGGGLALKSSSEYHLLANQVVGNTASASDPQSHGGGVELTNGSAVLINNIVAQNHAAKGAGLCGWEYAALDAAHNSIDANEDQGLYLGEQCVLSAENNIVSAHSGAGLYAAETSTSIVLTNTLWWNNAIDHSGAGVVMDYAAHHGDPRFANASGSDYHILSASAALDAGADCGVESDYEGDARPLGAGYDLGADEWRAGPSPTQTPAPTSTPVDSGQSVLLLPLILTLTP